MENVKLQMQCTFFGHGNLQQAGDEWKGNRGLRYFLYLISRDGDLKDAVQFGYGWFDAALRPEKREALLADVDRLYLCDEKDGDGDNNSRNTLTAKMMEQADENSTIDLRPNYSVQAPIEEN